MTMRSAPLSVSENHGGAGHGSTLVRSVLDEVRARGLSVRPMCPYARAWIEKHPEYADLVVAAT